MRVALAVASLTRHRARSVLGIAGIAVSAAMLLDMVMLSSGMRESFRGLLEARGFALRLSPKGTLPFDSEATIGGAAAIVSRLQQIPSVTGVAPVLGAQLHVPRSEGARTLVTLGLTP
jgi:putative ABC transport system permease protein